MSKFIRIFAAGVLFTGLPMAAMAQTTITANVQVQVVVQGSCTLSNNGNASQTVQPLAAMNLAGSLQGSVTLTCNNGAAPVLAVGNGGNHNGTTRRLVNNALFHPYNVKQPTISGTTFTCPGFGAGTDWSLASTLAASSAFSSSGGPRTVPICFQTTVDESTATGTWTDTVVVSATY